VSKSEIELCGIRVFVVEDEFAVLLMVEDILGMLGCKLAASASHIGPALEAARDGAFDVAVLDINIAGDMVYPVAEVLATRKVPIVFSTGYGVAGVEEAWRVWPILQKPYRPADLGSALRQALTGRTADGA
jgi:CheY-like chemotaxis protein